MLGKQPDRSRDSELTALNMDFHICRKTLDTLPDLIFLINARYEIIFANKAAVKKFGVEIFSQSPPVCHVLMHGMNVPPEFCPQCKTLETGKMTCGEAYIDLLETHYLVTTTPIFDDGDRYIASLHVARDITELKQNEKKLRYMAVHDPLTEVYNRTWLDAEMTRLAQEEEGPISVLVADVDGLKATNDTRGHAAGDQLLQKAVELLLSSTRGSDHIARIGGDEFIILLPGVPEKGVMRLQERILQKLEQQSFTLDDGSPISLSIGVATTTDPLLVKETLAVADHNMYLDKQRKKRIATEAALPTANTPD
ncbi:MAG: hypothetical protein C0622_00910 [Desulfuromonas sp.]|nr:MAG: hypothetical protein C0622_00910 [Desulfuromonas sp.]